uniref:Uncharacterized protein n=1 Tax=Rhizophagus irregularis (strain DAOM 181602 / DAOM 197198 / MUCL 43194) TaxID=747089 RepID=U9UYA5_RHIID
MVFFLHNKYKIITRYDSRNLHFKFIGFGGSAAVYVANWKNTSTKYAIKRRVDVKRFFRYSYNLSFHFSVRIERTFINEWLQGILLMSFCTSTSQKLTAQRHSVNYYSRSAPDFV